MSRPYSRFLLFLPFALANYAVEFYVGHNISELARTWTQVFSVLQLLALVNLGTAACFVLFFFGCRRSPVRASLCTAAVVLFVTYFTALKEFLSFGLRYRYFLIGWTALLLLSLGLLLRMKEPTRNTSSALAAVVVTLICLPIPSVFINLVSRYNNGTAPFSPPQLTVPADAPDVYYLIVDSYPNEAALARFHAYDNSDFTNQLERDLGFHVVRDALTNYPFTLPSTSSSLGMTYPRRGMNLIDLQSANHVAATFRNADYQIYAFRGLDISGMFFDLPGVDAVIDCPSIRRLQLTFAQLLPLGHPFFRRQLPSMKKRNTDCIFAKLAEFAEVKSDRPRLAIAYFYPIHEEFAISADGAVWSQAYRDEKYTTQAGLRELYIEELRYMNGKLLETLAHIVEVSDREPIIVIQGDHGTRFVLVGEDDYVEPTKEQFLERWSILNAIRVAPSIQQLIPEDLTPVNTFRFLMGAVFGANIELLENQYFNTRLEPIDPLGLASGQ